MSQLVDRFGRVHRDLRLSLTDRCSLRCTYCMPEEFRDWIPGDNLLSVPELLETVAAACELGIDSVRLTGGEPLLHPQVLEVVRGIAAMNPRPQIALTTNALRLAELAQPLVDAGLDRINISIDTLQPARFQELTRRDRLHDVLAGIEAAQAAGLAPIKLNAVLIRGINDDEAPALLRFAMAQGVQMRFIEQMPLDAGHTWQRAEFVTAAEIETALRKEFVLTAADDRGSSPAEDFLVDGGPHRVGIIASVTRPFCGACDRLRLTADGQIRNCLFARSETDLRSILRNPALSSDQRRARIQEVMSASVGAKAAGHGIDGPGFLQPSRPMSAIGG